MLDLNIKRLVLYFALLSYVAKSYPVSTSSLALEEDFNDEETWGEIKSLAGRKSDKENDDDDDDDDSDVTISDIFPLVSSTPPMHLKGVYVNSGEKVSNRPDELVTSTPPTSALVTKLFPQLKPKQKSIAVSWELLPLLRSMRNVHG